MSASGFDPLAQAGAKAKGKRPYFLASPDDERLLSVIMAVAQELAVLRERNDTLERLLIAGGTLDPGAIDAFAPAAADAAERSAWTSEYLARILRIFQQQAEADTGERSSEEVGRALADS